MNEKPKPTNSVYVSCEVCLTEIPESASMTSEAEDYAQYFCGIECYNQWRDKEDPQESDNDKAGK
jgi:elongation factor P--beta-lysine ligase